jgi:hypothetical protein
MFERRGNLNAQLSREPARISSVSVLHHAARNARLAKERRPRLQQRRPVLADRQT